jgi:hypothetical protein
VDVASTPAVSYIVKMVQGATRSMLIDHAYLLESHFAHELPETLIGAIRWGRAEWFHLLQAMLRCMINPDSTPE